MSDHFEDRIREKLQEADFPFDQDAWAKMEQKLDAVAPTPTYKRRPFFKWWMGGMIVLFGVSAWITVWYIGREEEKSDDRQVVISSSANNNNDVDKTAAGNESAASTGNNTIPGNTNGNGSVNNVDKRSATSSSTENKTNVGGERDVDNVDNTVRSGKTITSGKLNKTPSNALRLSAGTNTTGNHIDRSPLSRGKAENNKNVSVMPGLTAKTKGLSTLNDENEKAIIEEKVTSGKEVVLSTSAAENSVANDVRSLPGNVSNQNINAAPELDFLNSAATKPVKITAALLAKPVGFHTNSIVEKAAQKRGFAIGFAMGPDYSVAPCFQFGDFGISAGLQLQYAFNDRWSVSTGAFYAKKIYGATKADYQSNYNFQKVNADCDVLDVPLNINYTLFQSGRHAWTATLGSSSYFMLKEDYEMYYSSTNVRKYEYKNGSQHYFSMLNLGIGYQQQSGRHFMWGLQPYAKIPISGVGHGNVKLTSFGVLLHVNLTEY